MARARHGSCVYFDVAGDASYFYQPHLRRGLGLGFASLSSVSFSVELLFGWPALALFAFWEEAPPVTDFAPAHNPKPKPTPKPEPEPNAEPHPKPNPQQVTDLIPSCTIAWILVVTGGRSALASWVVARGRGDGLGRDGRVLGGARRSAVRCMADRCALHTSPPGQGQHAAGRRRRGESRRSRRAGWRARQPVPAREVAACLSG